MSSQEFDSSGTTGVDGGGGGGGFKLTWGKILGVLPWQVQLVLGAIAGLGSGVYLLVRFIKNPVEFIRVEIAGWLVENFVIKPANVVLGWIEWAGRRLGELVDYIGRVIAREGAEVGDLLLRPLLDLRDGLIAVASSSGLAGPLVAVVATLLVGAIVGGILYGAIRLIPGAGEVMDAGGWIRRRFT